MSIVTMAVEEKPSETPGVLLTTRVAVASKEGIAISEHFGHAKQFYVYDLSHNKCEFLETRKVAHYCVGGHSDKSAFTGIVATLHDCTVVFVAKIGDGPKEKLSAKGIKAVADYAWEEIEPLLLDYSTQQGVTHQGATHQGATDQSSDQHGFD